MIIKKVRTTGEPRVTSGFHTSVAVAVKLNREGKQCICNDLIQSSNLSEVTHLCTRDESPDSFQKRCC